MSIRDTIAAELSAPPAENFYVGNPLRASINPGVAATPTTTRLVLSALPNLVPGDGIWFDDIWAILTPTAALNVQSASLRLVDANNSILKALGTPLFTTLALQTSPMTVSFNVAPKLVTLTDLQQYGITGVIVQPLRIELILAFSASTLGVILASKFRLVRGLQEA